jgi:hypothetical protein
MRARDARGGVDAILSQLHTNISAFFARVGNETSIIRAGISAGSVPRAVSASFFSPALRSTTKDHVCFRAERSASAEPPRVRSARPANSPGPQ